MTAELAVVPVSVKLAQVAAELALAVELEQVAAELGQVAAELALAVELALAELALEPVDVLLLPTVPVVQLVLLFVHTVLVAADAALMVAAVAVALMLVAHRMAVAHSNLELLDLEPGDTLAVGLQAGK